MVKSRSAYDKKQTHEIEDARLKNAKEYWKLLKGLWYNKSSTF